MAGIFLWDFSILSLRAQRGILVECLTAMQVQHHSIRSVWLRGCRAALAMTIVFNGPE